VKQLCECIPTAHDLRLSYNLLQNKTFGVKGEAFNDGKEAKCRVIICMNFNHNEN
jgi:hypothetical protein